MPFYLEGAIATLLSDMDTEIEFIEARLAKTRAVKQGTLQQRRTDRIRLPIADTAS